MERSKSDYTFLFLVSLPIASNAVPANTDIMRIFLYNSQVKPIIKHIIKPITAPAIKVPQIAFLPIEKDARSNIIAMMPSMSHNSM